MYKNKYLKYKNKYLQLKKIQKGGIVDCNDVYNNALGTCWAVSIHVIFTSGEATSSHLETIMKSFNLFSVFDSQNDFIANQIQKVQQNPQFKYIFLDYIYSDNILYLQNILNKFIHRYYSKVLKINYTEKPPGINAEDNPLRCEFVIADNFKKLFNPIFKLNNTKYDGNIFDQYLFSNLLSVFFLGYEVSFTNYYDNFDLIDFDSNKHLGILIILENHACCLYICNGEETYYNDNDKKIHKCRWKYILQHAENLYIEHNKPLRLIDFDSYENKKNLKKVLYLTVISKHDQDSPLDLELKKILQYTDYNSPEFKDRKIQDLLGNFYYKKINYPKAYEFFQLAADQGYANSQFNLGVMFRSGQGVVQDYVEAVRWFSLAAAQGNALAQYNLSLMFKNGYGVARDYVEAMRLNRLAAEHGIAEAQNMLGSMFHLGQGVAQDYTEAVRLYSLAAVQGLADAQFNLGLMFYNGQGVVQDDVEAVRLYSLAAVQGHAVAQFNLGFMFYHGQGVAQDYTEAVRLYSLAAAQGNADAQFNLGSMFDFGRGVAQDYTEAVRLYSLAAARGNAGAQNNLGAIFENGQGVAQDYTEAVRL